MGSDLSVPDHCLSFYFFFSIICLYIFGVCLLFVTFGFRLSYEGSWSSFLYSICMVRSLQSRIVSAEIMQYYNVRYLSLISFIIIWFKLYFNVVITSRNIQHNITITQNIYTIIGFQKKVKMTCVIRPSDRKMRYFQTHFIIQHACTLSVLF